MAQLETNLNDYKGNMTAVAFEGPGPIFQPKNVIRSDQQWGIKVEWEVEGPLVEWLDANFHITAHLESIGVGPEFTLPPVQVHTLSVPVNGGATATRHYEQNIDIAPGDIPAGVYKLVTTLQLFEAATGNPTPVAGFVESGMVQVFNPS